MKRFGRKFKRATGTADSFVTKVAAATLAPEADSNITNGIGSIVLNPTNTTNFFGTIPVTKRLDGFFWANAGDTFQIEAFEFADDNGPGSADAFWNGLEFNDNTEAVIGNAGSFFPGNITLDTEASNFDTEIAFYQIGGTLIGDDDDGGSGNVRSSLTQNLGDGTPHLSQTVCTRRNGCCE